jgi:hypothetical protein
MSPWQSLSVSCRLPAAVAHGPTMVCPSSLAKERGIHDRIDQSKGSCQLGCGALKPSQVAFSTAATQPRRETVACAGCRKLRFAAEPQTASTHTTSVCNACGCAGSSSSIVGGRPAAAGAQACRRSVLHPARAGSLVSSSSCSAPWQTKTSTPRCATHRKMARQRDTIRGNGACLLSLRRRRRTRLAERACTVTQCRCWVRMRLHHRPARAPLFPAHCRSPPRLGMLQTRI